jgi:AcrR family transcriptional regulator
MRRTAADTQADIMAAARARFAEHGYEKSTIRAIAADAKIDPAMVMRYFGSKERLFAATTAVDLRLPDLTAVRREEIGETLIAHFLDRWEGDETMLILLRAGVTHDSVADRMREIFATQLVPIIAQVSGDAASAKTRAGLIAAQVLGFALCRYVLRFPPVVAMDKPEIVGWIGVTIQRYATEPSRKW